MTARCKDWRTRSRVAIHSGRKHGYIAAMNKLITRIAVFFSLLLMTLGCSQSPDSPPPVVNVEVAADQPTDDADSVAQLEATGAKLKKDGNGNIVDVDFRGTEIDDQSLAPLTGLTKLRSLNLGDTAITDAALETVGKLTTLTNLDLRGCEVTDAGVASLGELTNLKALRFSGKSGKTDVTDDSMPTIAKLTNLKVLALDFLNFAASAEGLEQLGGLGEMSELYIGKTLVNDESLAVIADKFPKLKKLRAAASQVSDAGLESIARMTALEELDLSENSQIFDDGLKHLASMTQLKKLNLWRVQVTDEGVKHLAGLTNLAWLNLDNVGYLSDEGLVYLKGMNSLKFLHLGSTAITDAGLPSLKPLTSLDDLKVTRTGVTEEGVAELQKTLTNTKIQLKYLEGQ